MTVGAWSRVKTVGSYRPSRPFDPTRSIESNGLLLTRFDLLTLKSTLHAALVSRMVQAQRRLAPAANRTRGGGYLAPLLSPFDSTAHPLGVGAGVNCRDGSSGPDAAALGVDERQ